MIGLRTGLWGLTSTGVAPTGGGGPIDPPGPTGPTLLSLPVTPTARWHPGFSAVTTGADGRVLSAGDLQGLAPATGAAGEGPLAMTDANGHAFWRFDGRQYLDVAQSLTLDNREMAVFAVGRMHRPTWSNAILSLGNRTAGTEGSNPGGPALGGLGYSGRAYALNSFGRYTWGSPQAAAMIPGAQLQVMGALCRETAQGGYRLHLNRESVSLSQNGIAAVRTGAEIGRYATYPGNAGTWGMFDLYELIVVDGNLSDTEGMDMATALTSHYAIPDVTHQIVLEGDSITQGTGEVVSGLSAGMVLSTPGGPLGPEWRVVNLGSSGATVPTLRGRLDFAGGWADHSLPGRNVVVLEVGRNDFVASNQSAVDHYGAVVDYLAEPGVGALTKGWEARVMANIAMPVSRHDRVIAYRAMLRDPAFQTDTGAAPGQLAIIGTDLIEHGGGTAFGEAVDAANRAYYASDSTHPTVLGAEIRVTGGDTPQYGIAASL